MAAAGLPLRRFHGAALRFPEVELESLGNELEQALVAELCRRIPLEDAGERSHGGHELVLRPSQSGRQKLGIALTGGRL
jgi:hypothetical protein